MNIKHLKMIALRLTRTGGMIIMTQGTAVKIGYGRVSTIDKQDSSLENQRQLLKEYGWDHIYFEKSSGRNDDRKEFNRCIKNARC